MPLPYAAAFHARLDWVCGVMTEMHEKALAMPGPAAHDPRIILNQVRGSADRILFDVNARDNCCEPYLKLRRRCAELGYDFSGTTDQRVEDCRWVIFWDAWSITPTGLLSRTAHYFRTRKSGASARNLMREVKQAKLTHRLALFMFEPPPNCPGNFDPAIHDLFEIIFTWDPTLVDNRKYFQFCGPNPTDFPPVADIPYADRKLAVDFSSYSVSSHPRELNSERRALIRYFEAHHPDQFDLYGHGWNPTLSGFLYRRFLGHKIKREFFPSYRGPVRQKSEVYPRYRFGICYENTRDQPGYISLKLIDCLRCGVIPVYRGAPDITDFVDKEAFIDRREFASNEELGKFLVSVGEDRFRSYQEAGRRFLASERGKRFFSENFVDTVVHALGLVSQ
jgi:hypothetical protein